MIDGICPAARAAARVMKLETQFEAETQMAQAWGAEGRTLEPDLRDLLMEIETARSELARAEPRTWTGAMAQLLAAIRDGRVGDDEERLRARELEARATAFLSRHVDVEPEAIRALSQTHALRRRPEWFAHAH